LSVRGIAEQEEARVEGEIEPLVEVDDDRVGVFDAAKSVAKLGHEQRCTAVRGVDVEPEPMSFGDLR
jgi:hypothetical protein